MNPFVSRCGRYKLYKKNSSLTGGSILLTMAGKVLFQKEMQRPTYVDVACNGTVIVGGILGSETESIVSVFDQDGTKLFEKYLTANVCSCAISDNSKVIYFETLKSKTDHSCQFFIYDTRAGKEIARYDSPFCAFGVKLYIDTDKQQLVFNFKEDTKTIDFFGKLIL